MAADFGAAAADVIRGGCCLLFTLLQVLPGSVAVAARLPVLVRVALEALAAVLAGVNQLRDGVHGGIKVLPTFVVLGGSGGLGRRSLIVLLLLAIESCHVAGEVVHGLKDGVAPAALDVAVLVQGLSFRFASTTAGVAV